MIAGGLLLIWQGASLVARLAFWLLLIRGASEVLKGETKGENK